MRNASERLYDEYTAYISEKTEAERRAKSLLASDPNADTTSLAQLMAEMDRNIADCHERARKLGTSLF